MVWARNKLLIQDDLISPRPRMNIEFGGKSPERFYKEIPKLLATVFRVHADSIQEKKFVMHKGEPNKFKAEWEIIKDLDKFSYYKIAVTLSGQSSRGHGEAIINVEGLLNTEYPQDSAWQRSIFYEMTRLVWHKIFYTSKRRLYINDGKRLISIFVDDIKALTRV